MSVCIKVLKRKKEIPYKRACEGHRFRKGYTVLLGLEEGRVVGLRGGVGPGVEDFSSGHATLNLGPRGGHGLYEMAMRLLESGACVDN